MPTIRLGKNRLVYLIAFSSLLPLIPSSLCLSDLPTVSHPQRTRIDPKPRDIKILPLLLRSLSLPDPTRRTNAIITLNSILETGNMSRGVDSLIHQQAGVMVESLLRSALPDPTNSGASSGVS
jgi:DNA repair/transcription protein MET18/MMS19